MQLSIKTIKIHIYVYSLTRKMYNNEALDLNGILYKTSYLDVSLIKQQQIKSLEN